MSTAEVKSRRAAGLKTPTNLGVDATRDISGALNLLLADLFALYLKTKNFHWHVSGPHFRDYHLLLDEQADQIYAITDPVAERVRKLGGTTLRSIGQIGRSQRVLDNDAEYVTPLDMLAELREDDMRLAAHMRETHVVCDEHGDVATASLREVLADARPAVRQPEPSQAPAAARLRAAPGARHAALRRRDGGRALPAARPRAGRGRRAQRRARHADLLPQRHRPGRFVRPAGAVRESRGRVAKLTAKLA